QADSTPADLYFFGSSRTFSLPIRVSDHEESAVDFESLSLDEACAIGAEVEDGVGDLFGGAEPAGGCGSLDVVEHLLGGEGAVVIRVDGPGRDGVHADP